MERKCQIEIVSDRCKGCSFCIEFCPRHVLAKSKESNNKGYNPAIVVNPEDCTNCQICVLICPDFAIKVTAVGGDKNGG